MASEKHKTAKRSRDTAKKERKALVQDRKDARKEGKSKSVIAKITRSIMNKSAEMRTAGDTMRRETGREKGQRTTYTGPAKQKTINLIKKTTGQTLPEETKWQQVNAAWQNELMKEQNLTRAQARSKLKTIFANNRQRYLTEQQRRYDANIVANVVEVDDGKTKDGKVKIGEKPSAAGLGDVMLQTPYTRPAPKDWSNLRYTYAGSPQSELGQVTQTPASRAMFGDKGAALQPWATGQGIPAGLLNYQIPGGTQANVAYSGGNPSLFDFNQQQNVTNQNNAVTNPLATDATQWVGVLPNGQRTNDFAAWQQAQHDAMYPGRQAAAQAAGFGGFNYGKEGAGDWRASLPGGATGAEWRNQYGTAAEQAGAGTKINVGKTATEQLIALGLIDVNQGKT